MTYIDNILILPFKILFFLAIFQFSIIGYNWLSIQYVTSTLADDASKNGELQDVAVERVANHINRWIIGSPDNISRSSSYAVDESAAVIWGPATGTIIQRGQPFAVGITLPIQTHVYILDSLLHRWELKNDTLCLKATFTGLSDRYYE